MRLPGRLSAAIEVLAAIETRHRPVAEALKDWGQANRFAGAGDRAAIGNLVYDALRKRASHVWAMGANTPRALVLSVAVRDWGETPEGLNDLFAQDSHAPAIIDADEARRLSAPDPLADAPEHVRADLPEWVAPLISDAVAEGRAMASRPPLDLRVNTLKATRERVQKSLARFGPREAAHSPVGLRMPAGFRDARTPNVTTDEGYLKGWFEVQDEGSQCAALLTGAKAGEQVLDLCAGAGGKTLAIGAAMENKGQIFAYDSDRSRLAPIYDRLKRSGVRNVQVRPPNPGALDDLAGHMDRVLVDAPCTGSGTWRRRPDAKWKLTPEQVNARTAEQDSILQEAARFVRVGGNLTYVTCSILPEENDGRVRAFLAAHPAFTLEAMDALWRGRFPTAPHLTPGGGVALSPHRTDTDGFFVAVLTRRR
jgi:16S rRNA (cytosine967-C5)-methyltransferase